MWCTHCGIDLLVVACLAECSKVDARALVRETHYDISGITKLIDAFKVQLLLLTWPDCQLDRKATFNLEIHVHGISTFIVATCKELNWSFNDQMPSIIAAIK